MNVGELIELLKQVDPVSEVYTEGCDCIDKGFGILVETKPDQVTIVRNVYDVMGYLSPPQTVRKEVPKPKPRPSLEQLERESGIRT